MELLRRQRSTVEADCNPMTIVRSIWIANQLAVFPTEMESLQNGRMVSGDSPLPKFVPFLDEHGVMKARTRFQTGEMEFDSPIIGDDRSHVRRAWLEWLHESNGHLRVAAMLTRSREHHLILHLRSVCRSICFRC